MTSAPATSPRERFATMVRGIGADIRLGEAALLIAEEEYPDLNSAAYLGRLDDLARAVGPRLVRVTDARQQVEELNHFLFAEEGFRGNQQDYYDPDNSYLNQVLDRKLGIPILLALVYTEIGQRIGLPVFGVGFPGHFLVKYVGSDELLVDPFTAKVVGPEQCLERLRSIYGPGARLRPEFFQPAQPKEILVRILRNLKHVYLQRRDWTRALACSDRILLVLPQIVEELRDRGLLYHRIEAFSAALADLERFLELSPSHESADKVRALIPDLRRALSRLN